MLQGKTAFRGTGSTASWRETDGVAETGATDEADGGLPSQTTSKLTAVCSAQSVVLVNRCESMLFE